MESPNTYNCDNCQFVYRAADFNGVDLDEQTGDFACPTCQAGVDHFHLVVPPDDDVAGSEEPERVDEIDPLGERLMYTKDSAEPVESLVMQHKKGRLDLQPTFQRYEVWSKVKNSRLIESIILDLPIPLVYVSQESKILNVVIDGQQRLSAIINFVNDNYALTGVTGKINGKKFSQLPDGTQVAIESYKIRQVQILMESDPEVKFMLFQRLNEGSTSLNDQELRNCVRRGTFNDFLKKLASEAAWRKLLRLRGSKPHPRMVDVELALRYFAYRDQSYMKHPDKKTGKFLDDQMLLGGNYSDKDYEKGRKDFRTSVDIAQSIFGDHACRRYVTDPERPERDGKWDARINRALMDVQLWGFNRHDKGLFIKNADSFREAALDLMSDPVFVDLITHTISESKRVEKRFDMWKTMVDRVITDPDLGGRLFPYSAKEELYSASKKCAICEQQIQSIDDAHVDHIVAYAKGGKTERANGQLVHRFCNLSKGDT